MRATITLRGCYQSPLHPMLPVQPHQTHPPAYSRCSTSGFTIDVGRKKEGSVRVSFEISADCAQVKRRDLKSGKGFDALQ